MSEFDKWKQVAHMFGESLAPVGPDGYYSFSPDQWLKWAKDQIRADEIARLHAENAALRDAVERVLALHTPEIAGDTCPSGCQGADALIEVRVGEWEWPPCSTLRALEGTP